MTPLTFASPPQSYVPPIEKAVVYEVNFRAFGPKVGFAAVKARLPKMKALGVNVIWLMPVQPVGKLRSVGQLGSPYALADYDSVNPEFGTSSDLREFVKAAHKLKMGVILDWVPDHTAWDHAWITAHPDWYLKTPSGQISIPRGTNWNDVAGFDFSNAAMRTAMIQSMKGWISNYDIDGFRCDAADRMPQTFWKSAMGSLRASTPKKLLMLAEGFAAENYASGFDLTYGWNFNSRLREIFKGKSASELSASAKFEQRGIPIGAGRLRFTTNHDIAAWEGSEAELYHTPAGARTAFAITALYGGVPLIYTGQEVGFSKRIPIFDQSSIDWPLHSEVTEWMSRLIDFRQRQKALQTGSVSDFSSKDVVAFIRSNDKDEIMVLANVRGQSSSTAIPQENRGEWKDVLAKRTLVVAEQMVLGAYEHRVLQRRHDPARKLYEARVR